MIDPSCRKAHRVICAIGVLIAVGIVSIVFFDPALFYRVFTFMIALAGLLFPIGFTFLRQLYAINVRWIAVVGLPVVLFFGIMLPISGSVGMPVINNIIQPAICPAGFDEIKSNISTRRFDMPGNVMSMKNEPVCTGELGEYKPGRGTRMLGGIAMYLLYCGIYFSVAAVVSQQKVFKRNFVVGHGVILAVFIALLFVSLLNPSVASILTRPIKGLIYRGHAVSLVEAVKRHKIGMIEDLLARGGDINAQNAQRETALAIATKFNDKEALALFSGQLSGLPDARKALLDKRIVYDEANYVKQLQEGNIENVGLFLDAGMDIDALLDGKRFTALRIAVEKRHKELAQFLLERKADVNKPGPAGKTPLHAAAMFSLDRSGNEVCRDDIVLLLIRNNADVNAGDEFGNTPLMDAVDVCPAAARALVENKADVNSRSKWGDSALLSAVWQIYLYDKGGNKDDKERYDLVKYLLEHGADPNVNIYSTGDTPLRIARKSKVREVIELLTASCKGVKRTDRGVE